MTEFEKVEKLRMRADVSYEEAKKALDEANGDILDAMIILENQGKTIKPSKESYSTKYEELSDLPAVVSDDANDKKDKKEKSDEFLRKVKVMLRKLWVNFVDINRNEKHIMKLPLWLFVLIVLLGIHFVPILIVISLLFGCRYTFSGEDELKLANEAAQKAEKVAGDIVDVVKDEYNKL